MTFSKAKSFSRASSRLSIMLRSPGMRSLMALAYVLTYLFLYANSVRYSVTESKMSQKSAIKWTLLAYDYLFAMCA